MAQTMPSELSFPASRRIRKRGEYLRIQKVGEAVRTQHFVVLIRLRADDEPARLGLTVSKKVANAVGRNRVKRVAREAFRLSPALFPPGADIVLIARSGADALSTQQVTHELGRARGNLAAAARRQRTP